MGGDGRAAASQPFAGPEDLRTTFEAMSEGLVVQEAGGAIVLANPAAERILGLSAEQLSGRTSLDPRWRAVRGNGAPFPGDEHPAMVTLRTGAPTSNVLMGVYRPSGDLVWISVNTRLLRARTDGRRPFWQRFATSRASGTHSSSCGGARHYFTRPSTVFRRVSTSPTTRMDACCASTRRFAVSWRSERSRNLCVPAG